MDTRVAIPAPAPGLRPFGEQLRDWRQRRRLSQMELAAQAQLSTRHLSFLETGRSTPSRDMVLRLAQRLAVPLRGRNALLVAAGYAPMYRERALDDPALAAAREAVDLILRSHEPYPALAVDRHWNLLAANRMLAPLLAGIDAELLRPPVNVLRLSLHPRGIAPRIVNLAQWRHHLFERLQQQVDLTGDPVLQALAQELRGFPAPAGADADADAEADAGGAGDPGPLAGEVLGVAVPLQLRTATGVLSFISTVTVFGTPVDVTLQELALETFFPADAPTADALRALAATLP